MEAILAREPDPAVRQFWRDTLQQFDSFHGTINQFCDEQGVSTASFYNWRRRFRDDRDSQTPTLVPVRLIDQPLANEEELIRLDIGPAQISIPAKCVDVAKDIAIALADAEQRRQNAANRQSEQT